MYISHRRKNDLSNKSNTETGYLENEQNLYLAPISSVENSRKMLNRIAAMIRHFCEIQQHQKELEEQEKKLRSERKKQRTAGSKSETYRGFRDQSEDQQSFFV